MSNEPENTDDHLSGYLIPAEQRDQGKLNMERHVRELRSEIERLEVDVQSAEGSKVLLSPEERERLAKVRARIDQLRRLLEQNQ